MTRYEQQVIDRDDLAPANNAKDAGSARTAASAPTPSVDAQERAARATLRAQIARLERERASIVAERFPYIAAPPPLDGEGGAGPMLLDLGQLERVRDQLAAGVQELHAKVRERSEHERRARELLERMRLEPGRYKFVRLPVRDLGEGVCGVWEVRPRLGLIGMLAGWWQLKLSSGCPLAKGPRTARPRRVASNKGRARRGPGASRQTRAAQGASSQKRGAALAAAPLHSYERSPAVCQRAPPAGLMPARECPPRASSSRSTPDRGSPP